MNEEDKKKVREGIENSIKKLEELRNQPVHNSVLFGVEAQVANSINYSEYQKYITPEEANKYRTQVLNSGN